MIVAGAVGFALGPVGLLALAGALTIATVATHGVGAGVDAIIPIRPLIASVNTLGTALRSGDYRKVGESAVEIGFSAAAVIGAGAASRSIARSLAKKEAYSVGFEFKLADADIPRHENLHYRRANEALDKAMQADPQYARMMEDMIPGIREAVSSVGGRENPPGWTWHHVSDRPLGQDPAGYLHLVPEYQHTPGSPFWKALHPTGKGGYSIWAVPRGAPPRHGGD